MIRYLIPFVLLASCASAPTSPPPSGPSAGFPWMDGCWQTADAQFKEVWATADTGLTAGVAMVQSDGQTLTYETTVAQSSPLFYLEVTPSKQDSVRFDGTSKTETSAVFENSANDYPQRITYVREAETLTATIALNDGSREKVFAFKACPKD